MYIEQQKISKHEIRRISFAANIILITIFVILLFAFWNTQILKSNYYSFLATQNMIKDFEVKSPRGFILDRNRNRLAENRLNFTLFLVREFSKELPLTVSTIAPILGKDKNDLMKKIDKYKGYPDSFMIPLEKNLPMEKVVYLESRSDELPELKIEVEPARAYPYSDSASHVMGYISELSSEELSIRKKDGYSPGDIAGKSGIEKQYESALKGVKGFQQVARDNQGRIREVLKETKPIIGKTTILTIDIELQKYVESIFKDKDGVDHNGAVAIVELKTGDIMAMVSKPNYNPNFFSGVLEQTDWNMMINDPNRPLQNKSMQGLYAPGSIFKIVMALAGLQESVIDGSTVSQCSGNVKIYDRNFHCWSSGHGTLNVVGALKYSCNVFFYRVGKRLDIDIIAKYAHMLGLGEKTGIDLPNERKGIVPTKEWKLNVLNQKWFPGETISVAIGGGMLNITPIQALEMISTVALRGKRPKLHLLKSIEQDGVPVFEVKPEFRQVPISRENFETVIEGLFNVVNSGGTGGLARVPGLDICGKTGTQQVISKENPNYKKLSQSKQFKPHSWFVSFAPRENPQYAMVIFIEHGGDAGGVTAPLASLIYKKIFRK